MRMNVGSETSRDTKLRHHNGLVFWMVAARRQRSVRGVVVIAGSIYWITEINHSFEPWLVRAITIQEVKNLTILYNVTVRAMWCIVDLVAVGCVYLRILLVERIVTDWRSWYVLFSVRNALIWINLSTG